MDGTPREPARAIPHRAATLPGRPHLRYRELRPDAALLPLVECVWVVSDPRARASRPADRVLPDGCPELIVHLGDPFSRWTSDRWVAQPRCFVAGTLTKPWRLRAGPRVLTVGLRFRPGALTSFFASTLDGTCDREIPIRDLASPGEARALVAALRGARTDTARLAAASAWLAVRRETATPPRTSARDAVARILESRGQARIDDVALALGWSRRRMERVFARELGIAPKLYARIVRLNAVLATLDADEQPRAVDLALEAGYFDQAHLLRDFRVLAGRTPRTPRDADGRMARHFTHPRRLRALFAGE